MGGSADYGSPSDKEAVNERLERRLESMKNSLSYRLGKLIVDTARKPWIIPLFPISLPRLLWDYSQERMGNRSISESSGRREKGVRECVVLFPTNGVGMGHYSRMFALALSLKRKRPELEIVFFTTNYVLHPIYSEGMTCYHLPNRTKFEVMDARTWNDQCQEMLSNIFSVHKPSAFVFDGAYPYRGMLNAIKNRDETLRIWVRRITRKGQDNAPADSYGHFNRIVVPGDLIDPDMGDMAKWPIEEINMIPPLLSVSRSDLYERGSLRARLGIPEEASVALVSLGAGEINDITSLRDYVVQSLTDRGVYVIIADSMLKPMRKKYQNELIRVVQIFPIMRNRACFDFAVIAGGYNSVNECILLRLPTVIFPNFETQRDDQPGRAKRASEIGGSIVVENIDKSMIEVAMDRICDEDVRSEMAQRLVNNYADDGAETLAENLISSVQKFRE